MQYQRIFVTLKQDRQDYSIDGRKCMGRCVIETRGSMGKLSIYVQGLKPEVIYKLYLIATERDKSKGLPVAIVPVHTKGKGELRFEFNAENVGGSNMSVSDFSAITIIVPSENGVLPVLTGFMEDEISWKNNFVDITKEDSRTISAAEKPANTNIEIETHEIAPVQEHIENIVEQSHTMFQAEPVIEEEPEIKTEDPIIQTDVSEKIMENKTILLYKQKPHQSSKESVEPTEEYNMTPPQLEEQVHSEIKGQNINHGFKELISEYDSYMKNLGKKPFDGLESIVSNELPDHIDELEHVFLNHVKMNPFPNDHKQIKWVRIIHKDLVLLGDKGYYSLNHPLILLSYRRYKHLILGKHIIDGKSKYILGVPDCYSVEYKETATNAGFLEFKYCERSGTHHGDYGYWIKDI